MILNKDHNRKETFSINELIELRIDDQIKFYKKKLTRIRMLKMVSESRYTIFLYAEIILFCLFIRRK